MSKIDGTLIKYEFTSLVTFANGKRSQMKKIESLSINKKGNYYICTFEGSCEETLQNEPISGINEVVLSFGKALYPLSIKVTTDGNLEEIVDFPMVKERWMKKRDELVAKYDNNYYINKEAESYALGLKSEETLLSILKENMFYKLLFWQVDKDEQTLEIRDFPSYARSAVFSFRRPKKENGSWLFDTFDVRDEGSGHILSGRSTLSCIYDDNGWPESVKLKTMVEEENIGYFTKEIAIKKIEE